MKNSKNWKKTVYWVKTKPKKEDGLVKGEKWTTSQKHKIS